MENRLAANRIHHPGECPGPAKAPSILTFNSSSRSVPTALVALLQQQ